MPHVTLPALAELFRGKEVDFVFSVWDRIGRKIDGAMNSHQLQRVFEFEALCCLPTAWFGVTNIWPALPLLRSDLEVQAGPQDRNAIVALIEEHFPGAVIDVEDGVLLDLEFDDPREDKNSIRMLYKIWRANEICRQTEKNSAPYDAIMRVRPDAVIGEMDFDHVLKSVKEGYLLTDNWRSGYCGDNFAVGNRDSMNVYASTFGRALTRTRAWRHIHRDLHDTIAEGGVRVRRYWPHLQLADEPRVSIGQVVDSIEAMEIGTARTATHEVTLASLRAAAFRIDGRHDEALATLFEVLETVRTLEPTCIDGWLHQLALTLHIMGRHEQSALVALSVRMNDEVATSSRGDELNGCLVAALSSPAGDMGVSPFRRTGELVEWLEGHPGLTEVLATGLGCPVDEMLDRPQQIPLRVVHRLVRRLETTGRADLAQQLAMAALEYGDFAPIGVEGRKYLLRVLLAVPTEDRIEYLVRLSGRFRDDVEVLYPLADLLKVEGRTEDAIGIQQHAVRIAPRHAGARRQLSELLAIAGRFDEARQHAQTAYDLNAGPHYAILLAYLFAKIGDAAAAKAMKKSVPDGFDPPAAYGRMPDFDETVAAL